MFNEYLISADISVKKAMHKMDESGKRVLFVVNEKTKLEGALTDGDVRRWILREGSLTDEVRNVCNSRPLFVREGSSPEEMKKLMLKERMEGLPVINADNQVVEVLFWDDLYGEIRVSSAEKLDMPVVIMAGGKGTRLDPFTRILPKPLIPIGERTIIDIIMEKFSHHGIKEFYISINHKAKMIKSYFEEMDLGYVIHYIEEEKPLGTAGSLRFLHGKVDGSVIVSNCDIIVDCDYREVVDFHTSNGYDMTMVGSFRHFVIPYGICEIGKDGVLVNMTEKPEYDFLVNTGMSVLKSSTFALIDENRQFDITDLAEKIKANGGKVGVFPINEKSWIDIGQWEEYHKSLSAMGIK